MICLLLCFNLCYVSIYQSYIRSFICEFIHFLSISHNKNRSCTTIYRQCLIPITIKPIHPKSHRITQKQKHQNCSIHCHYKHHWGDMKNRVQTIIQKVKHVLFPCQHTAFTLVTRPNEVLFHGLTECGQADCKVCNYGG